VSLLPHARRALASWRPLALFLVATPLILARVPAPAEDPWALALAFDFPAAERQFAEVHRADPTDSRVALARAAVLLVRQPRTNANLAEALRLREELVAAPEVKLRPTARYLLARLHHEHLATPDLMAAQAGYAALQADPA
jgi:hypothetical protein